MSNNKYDGRPHFRLSEPQKRALEKIGTIPQTARAMGERESTLRNLANRGLCVMTEYRFKPWEPFERRPTFHKYA